MKPKPMQARAVTDGLDHETLILDGVMRGNSQVAPLEVNRSAVNQDGSRKREIGDLVHSIQVVRDEMATLKPNDPRWSVCFANLSGLLSKRDRLKDS